MSKNKPIVTAHTYSRRGRLLASRANSYTKTHPLQKHFATLAGQPARQYLHAELAALLASPEPVHKIVIERFNANGEPVCAKPCQGCLLAIKAWGVKKVEYT